jgi:hypothetical protein
MKYSAGYGSQSKRAPDQLDQISGARLDMVTDQAVLAWRSTLNLLYTRPYS